LFGTVIKSGIKFERFFQCNYYNTLNKRFENDEGALVLQLWVVKFRKFMKFRTVVLPSPSFMSTALSARLELLKLLELELLAILCCCTLSLASMGLQRTLTKTRSVALICDDAMSGSAALDAMVSLRYIGTTAAFEFYIMPVPPGRYHNLLRYDFTHIKLLQMDIEHSCSGYKVSVAIAYI